MSGRAISFVSLEPIPGILQCTLHHEPVARHLGNDRGGSDRKTECVTMHNGGVFVCVGPEKVAVDQHMLRPDDEFPEGNVHRRECRVQDILTVYFFMIHQPDTY